MAWRYWYRRYLECPDCGSHEVVRSRRRGALESLLKAILRLRPYRCRKCSLRFFGYAGAVPLEPSAKKKEVA